jgi:Na+/proline symporter/signal transduction histidine kinase
MNIDNAIFVGFLAINLIVGLSYGRGVKNIKDYALGGRNFSTGTIAATLVATWIGGGFFAWNLSKAYSDGLPFITAVVGNGLAVLILGYFYSPRVGEFLGCNSVAEVMGNLYGKRIRLITSIAAMCLAIGYSGLQIKVLSNLISWSLGVDGRYAAISGAIVVIVYSTFGGIRSVTFTDVIQFLTFGAFVPALALLIWGSFDSPGTVMDVVSSHPDLFDYHSLFTLGWLTLFLWMACPDLDPAMFQRVLIAKNVAQVRRSFIIASIGCITIICTTSWIGLLIFAKNPGMDPDQIINYIIQNYSYTGLRGFTMVGIAAMVMSTVDSYINSASIVFANDFCTSVGIEIKSQSKRLLLSRCFAVVMGLVALLVALSYDNIFELTLVATNFYMPIVTIPLTLAIFGFRSSSKSVLIGMIAGFSTVVIWRNYFYETGIDSVIPAMCANLIAIITSHYLLRQAGGWTGIKDTEPLRLIRLERKIKWQNFIKSIQQFRLLKFCEQNSPKEEYVYSYFAIFSIISVFSTIYTLPQNIQQQNQDILSFIYHTVLIASTLILTYPIWPNTFKNKKFISIFWNIAIFYILVCVSTLFILIGNFGQFQLMMLVLNIFVLSSLVRWQVTLLMVPLVCVFTIQFYKWYMQVSSLDGDVGDLQFKIIYSLLLVSSALIGFVKPKQEYIEATEEKVGTLESEISHLGHEVTDLNEQVTHYSEQVADKNKEIERLGATAQKILNNVNHELRLPIGNVVNFSEMLHESLGKSDNKLVKELSKEVYDNSNRVSTMILNMLDLATLDVKKVNLQKTTINFSELVTDRVKRCRKIYLRDKKIDFELTIEPEVMIAVDPNYIRQTIDNLVINAINFSTEGLIKVSVSRKDRQVMFTLMDQGKGIPKNELSDIFNPFKMGSNSESKASGRGVGLALCKSAVEAHGGSISADSNGEIGAILRFTLPFGNTK